jgi:hypothetical protein
MQQVRYATSAMLATHSFSNDKRPENALADMAAILLYDISLRRANPRVTLSDSHSG